MFHDNDAMERAPFVVTSTVAASSLAFAVHFAINPEPFGSDAAALLAASILLFALISATGLLLSRGRWALRLSLTLVAGQLALGLVIDLEAAAVTALGLSAVALGGLTGPWLGGWIRRRTAAGGPGPKPVILVLGVLALAPAIALVSPDGLEWQHLVLAAFAVTASWSYSRASLLGLWAIRVALAPIAATAIFVTAWPGAVYLAGHTGVLVVLAWSKDSMLAIRPLLDRLYGPRAARPQTSRERRAT